MSVSYTHLDVYKRQVHEGTGYSPAELVYGRNVTDHNPLTYLKTMGSANARLMRWALALQLFDFVITHKVGKYHKNADSLSRAMCQKGDVAIQTTARPKFARVT